MKEIAAILVVFAMSLGFTGGTATAQQANCDSIVITNTGPNSNNQGVCVVNTTVSVTCVNNVYVLNQNDQTAVTGQASSLGNTSGGPAITGNAQNENGTNVQIGATCSVPVPPTPPTPTPETPEVPTPPETPVTPAQPTAEVTVLPYTAANATVTWVAIGIAAALTALVTTLGGLAIYRKRALK